MYLPVVISIFTTICADQGTNQDIGEDQHNNTDPNNQPNAAHEPAEESDTSSQIYEPDRLQTAFEDIMTNLEWRTCPKCKEKFMTKKSSKKKCCHTRPICRALSEENNMDPGPVPEPLQNLTSTEEQLISIIHPVLQLYRVKGHQLCYSGNIINFPQDVKTFAKKLPHNINEMTSMVKVRTSKDATNYKDFRVRAAKVKAALEWLRENNPYYFDIQLCPTNMALLPEDGNVYDLLKIIGDEKNANKEQDETQEEADELEETEDELKPKESKTITETNMPMFAQPTEKDQIETVIDWPKISSNAIDEFHTEGYIAKAFPCLFPWGKADIYVARLGKISETTYFQHLMRYYDDRFARHSRFRFFALNSLMRWAALKDGNIFVKRNPELAKMTVADLKEKIEEDPGFLKKIMFQASNIRGTKAFWNVRGRELRNMIEQLGMPTLFLTLSAADMHWPELYKILAPDEDIQNITEQQRWKLVQDNPLVVDEFFLTRAETFIAEVMAFFMIALILQQCI